MKCHFLHVVVEIARNSDQRIQVGRLNASESEKRKDRTSKLMQRNFDECKNSIVVNERLKRVVVE